MSEILFQYYKIHPTTWVYVSSLLIIAVFFKFNRFWSVRNLDLVMLILLAPGMLMVNLTLPWRESKTPPPTASIQSGDAAEASAAPVANPEATTLAEAMPAVAPPAAAVNAMAYYGYVWLFAISALWLVRLLLDPTMVRRPLLEPNLSSGGLIFLGCSLFIFLMANVITSNLSADDLRGAEGAHSLIAGRDTTGQADAPEDYRQHGPGYYLMHLLPSIPSTTLAGDGEGGPPLRAYMLVSKSMAILSHLAVVAALIVIGYWHFENIRMGIGAAALYLMLPYTAQMTGHVDHVLPAALLLWAIVLYRRPALAGIFLGLAAGVNYYPFFLLPLWISFYWQRGLARFLMGSIGAIAVLALSLVFVSKDLASFWFKFQQMFALWIPRMTDLKGIWGLGWDSWYRLPVIAGCVALAAGLAIWPTHKNLGTLLSCSAAMMVAVQFWHGFGDGGGMYIAWFLPLLLMTVFRPNLEDRVALTVLGEGWFLRRRARLAQLNRAA
ncbi:MAG TPA: glycosyltransferase family 87 protein [Pirellulaceae bacterium]|nr:glycosyltransferase family 87 protein [Pirellulaceae bacterium]